MDWKALLLSFEGRVGRKVFWFMFLAFFIVYAVLGVLTAVAGSMSDTAASGMSIIMLLAVLALIWPSLAIQAKRWHDQDRSAWWILIGLVPFVGGLIALVMCGFIQGTPGPNRFGAGPMA